MFEKKYKVTLLDSKWSVIKRNVNLTVIPRKDEYLYFGGLYYEVLNLVHTLDDKQDVFIIINETNYQEKPIENQSV